MTSIVHPVADRRWRPSLTQQWETLAALALLALLTYRFLWRLLAANPADRATFPEKSDTTRGTPA